MTTPAASQATTTDATPSKKPAPGATVIRKGTRPAAGERAQVTSAFWPAGKYRAGVANPNRLKARDFKEMEKDPQVRAGIRVRELLITAKPPVFNYKPKDPTDAAEKELGARMVGFLQWQWEHLEGGGQKLIHDLLSARRFGFAVLEKVMASALGPDGLTPVLRTLDQPEDYRGFVYLRKVKLLPADTIENSGIGIDEYGNVIMVQQNLAHYPRPPGMRELGGSIQDVPPVDGNAPRVIRFLDDEVAERLIVYAANKDDDSNPYGQSDHVCAYKAWYSKGFTTDGVDQLLELLSGNAIGVYKDDASQPATATALANLGIGGQVAIPEGSDIKILQGWEGAVQQFLSRINQADGQILRAYLVPELSLGGNAQQEGSNARASSDSNSLVEVTEGIKSEIHTALNDQFVKPLIRWNFGDVETYPTADFPPIAEKDRAAVAAIISQGIRDGYLDPVQDNAWMRRETGVPDDAQDYDAEAAAVRKAAAQPPQVSGGLGDFLPKLTDLKNPQPRLATTDPKKTDLAAQAAPDQAAPAFSRAESKDGVGHALDTQEATLASMVGDAARAELARILDTLPTGGSPEDLATVRVDAAWYAGALDEVADRVFAFTLADFARKLRLIATPEAMTAADRIDRAAAAIAKPQELQAQQPTLLQRLFGRRARVLAAEDAETPPGTSIEDVLAQLDVYRNVVKQRNQLSAEGYAATLQTRLRQRILSAVQAGMEPAQVARAVEDEFASYTRAQLNTVATTTVFDMYNTAREAGYDAAGDYVLGKRISILRDDHNTPFCRDIDGRSIAKDDPNYARIKFPAWYGCRTVTAPILALDEGWVFDTDWDMWIAAHEEVEGGGFWYGKA